MAELRRCPRRAMLGAAALAGTLLGGALTMRDAHASYVVCRTDPLIRLSSGTVVDLSATITDASSDIRGVAYTVRIPAGLKVTGVVYTGGALKHKETLTIVANDAANTFDATTVVTTGATGVHASSSMWTVNPRHSTVTDSGTSGQALTLHLG